MKNVRRLIVLVIIVFSIICIRNYRQAKYILTREIEEQVTVTPEFYFNAEADGTKVVFPRTSDEKDHETILTTETQVTLKVKNNDGTNYNVFPTEYTVEVVEGTKFSIKNEKYSGTIEGNELKDNEITFTLKINNLEDPSKKVKFRVTSTVPQTKVIDIELPVQQDGAIQTIEDLINLSLALRNHENEQYGWTSDDVKNARWKMTRDLDFNDDSSYENSHRTDFKNVNLDDYTNDLKTELTQDAGFLPIGMHVDQNGKEYNYWFMGTFNGGNHSISNLRIEKSLQMNIGLFGWVNGADIRNFTIKSGNIVNHNQTAAMVAGKMDGGIIENVTVDGNSVLSLDEDEPNRDTYAAGIAGYVEKDATIKNCINRATVTTQFTGDTAEYSGAAGGIAAWMAESNIINCTNYGTITGQKYIGGICGFAAMPNKGSSGSGSGKVSECHNYGMVTTYIKSNSTGPGTMVGGICGYLKTNGVVDGCVNHAEASISGTNDVGGIVGYNYGTVKNCTNYSKNISCTNTSGTNKGGIVGNNRSGNISENNKDLSN